MRSNEEIFKPKPGQTDFTHIRYAPVINCVLKCGPKILLVRRNEGLRLYPGLWSGISGFLDDFQNFDDKVKEELREEAGIGEKQIRSIRRGEIFHRDDPKFEKTWIVHPVLVEVHIGDVTLNAEGEEYRWVEPDEALKFALVPGFDMVLRRLSLI